MFMVPLLVCCLRQWSTMNTGERVTSTPSIKNKVIYKNRKEKPKVKEKDWKVK